MLLWPWPLPQIILGAVIGPYNHPHLDKKIYPDGDPARYALLIPDRYPSVSTMKLMGVVKLTRTLPLQTIREPSLWLYNNSDDAVDIPTLKQFYARAGGPKRLVHVDGAPSHMLAGDIFSPGSTAEVVGDILSFLRDSGATTGDAR